ncbi:MAG: fumarylacetoacetate hydrolase family protein [Kiritimatiellia bacterium]|jgi:2-keto-4-pentenoate hydratase/2-oxohepta-3-ene-1,7-dioic acid hydratase in catechol pathway
MKLIRFGAAGAERPGVWLERVTPESKPMLLDVRAMAFDIEDYNEHFFAHFGLERVANLLREPGRKLVPAEGARLGPPIARPGKIICLGKNYAAHAREFDAQIPESPILFSKAASAMSGPTDPIVLPKGVTCVDGEVELAVVIGRAARRVAERDALDYVAGYTVLNDVTDREAQRAASQWFRGKSSDTFCPLGPFLVTKDEIPDAHRLQLTSGINGQVFQNGTTADLIFNIPFLIAFISATITLLPGDVIATGTPAGIGSARIPPVYLKPGDRIECAVEGLGRQNNPVIKGRP